jgi:hypothetical protein
MAENAQSADQQAPKAAETQADPFAITGSKAFSESANAPSPGLEALEDLGVSTDVPGNGQGVTVIGPSQALTELEPVQQPSSSSRSLSWPAVAGM